MFDSLKEISVFLHKLNQELKTFDEDDCFLSPAESKKLFAFSRLIESDCDDVSMRSVLEILITHKPHWKDHFDSAFMAEGEKIKNTKYLDLDGNNIIAVSDTREIIILEQKSIEHIVQLITEKGFCLRKRALQAINLFINSIDEYEKISPILNGIPESILNYQYMGASFLALNKRAILADEMGLGKSIQSLTAAEILKTETAIVITSNSLKYKWRDEIKKFFPNKKPSVYSGKFDSNKCDFYIINYESVSRCLKTLKQFNADTLILDEVHYLKNHKSERARACSELSKIAKNVFGLTGTAIVNKPAEIAHQIDVIGKLESFGGYWRFLEKYAPEELERSIANSFEKSKSTENRVENLDSLHQEIRKKIYLRRTKAQVAKHLPKKSRTFIPVKITNRNEYESALSEYESLKQNKADRSKLSLKLHELREIASEGKYLAIKENIDSFLNTDEKLVVFCRHEKFKNKLLQDYPHALKIIREQDPEERLASQNEFLNNHESKLLIATIRVAYMGYDLYSASNAFFAEIDPCPTVNEQAEDRLHRIVGTTMPVNAWYFYAKNTLVDERTLEILEEKSSIINKTTKNKSDEMIYEIIKKEEDYFEECIFK